MKVQGIVSVRQAVKRYRNSSQDKSAGWAQEVLSCVNSVQHIYWTPDMCGSESALVSVGWDSGDLASLPTLPQRASHFTSSPGVMTFVKWGKRPTGSETFFPALLALDPMLVRVSKTEAHND